MRPPYSTYPGINQFSPLCHPHGRRASFVRHDEPAVADDIGCENGHEPPLYLLAGQKGPSVIAWGTPANVRLRSRTPDRYGERIVAAAQYRSQQYCDVGSTFRSKCKWLSGRRRFSNHSLCGPSGHSPSAKHGAVAKRSRVTTVQMHAGRMKYMRRSSHRIKCRSELNFVTSHLGGGRWYLSVQSTHDVHCINDYDDQFSLSASTSFVKNRLKGRARRLVSNI